MRSYKIANNVTGLIIFLIALTVYTLTLESTASFWDCGEFLAGADKMQVVHPPGAPLFLLVGRLFMAVAPDAAHKAVYGNFLSGLTSAFSVLFLFFITTHFARKLVIGKGEYTGGGTLLVMAAGVIAGLTCTFLDTIWFSAVEGEVYAMSLFFMMLVFWCMTKWEDAEERYRDRWLVLSMFLLGVSSGVHLLSFLAIPAMALIWYLKKYKPTPIGVIATLAAGFIILGFFFKGVVNGIIGIICSLELMFTNGMGLPFGTGFIVFVILVVAGLTFGLWFTRKQNKPLFNTAILSLLMVFLGFSTYAIVIIRANADTPINMNNPNDAFTLKSYLNREQYGSRPLMFGPHYNAEVTDADGDKDYYEVTSYKYHQGEKEYERIGENIEYEFAAEDQMFFPRMGSWQDERHVQAYRYMVEPDFKVVDGSGNVKKIFENTAGWNKAYQQAQAYAQGNGGQVKDIITQKENLVFFFKYQVGFMYFRYFLWNFAGRQNDIQGRFDNNDGRALSGISGIDEAFLGPQDNLPQDLKDNKGRNIFYLLPLILGIIGMIYHFYKDPESAGVVLVLFLFSGLFQVIYLNSPPFEPRERDYTLVASFVTFCLWIGFSVIAVADLLKKVPLAARVGVAFLIAIPVPVLMADQNWDDHDRSDRYTARDFAINYLQSCAPNAIIFTQGDNDTYPLWYAQEVEGIRSDIRVVNLSLLGVDWYVKQLNLQANDAPPVKLILTPDKYVGSNRDVTRFYDQMKAPADKFFELKDVVAFIASDDAKAKVRMNNGESANYLPTKNLKITVDAAKVKANNILPADRDSQMVEEIKFTLGDKNNLLKNDLVTLDIVASNIWERPIYFAVSVSPDAYLGLDKYFQLEGLAYRIVPALSTESGGGTGYLATDLTFDNIMKNFRWGGMERKKTIEYTVKTGQTADSVAYQFNTTVSQLKAWNSGASIAAGSKIKVVVPDPHLYLDENILRMTMNLRSNFARLATALANEGKKEKAEQALDKCMEVMPVEHVPINVFMLRIPEVYYSLGTPAATEKASMLTRKMGEVYEKQMKYSVDVMKKDPESKRNIEQALAIMQELMRVTKQYQDKPTEDELTARFSRMRTMYEANYSAFN